MNFSQRIGKVPVSKEVQLESLDDDLKNGLWNAIKMTILDNLNKTGSGKTEYDLFCVKLWIDYFKLPIDEIPDNYYECELFIKERFYNTEWYQSYDLLEHILGTQTLLPKINFKKYIVFCNKILEKEFSGYRFIGDHISPITNSNEINEIDNAITKSGNFTALKGANIHLKTALQKISDKKSPDYRNSIKESISAVESVAKAISENRKDTLGGALDKIKGKIKLHASLERGFKQLYGYTSDSDGIRHALMDNPTCDFEDAIYMLVSSSSFINYLIVKASKAGIILK